MEIPQMQKLAFSSLTEYWYSFTHIYNGNATSDKQRVCPVGS